MEEILTYLYDLQRTGIKLGLENIKSLLEESGVPFQKTLYIHVAGTNGKGSTCNMLSEILKTAGYKVGLFTSPHVLRFNERIRINGEEISDDELARLTEFFRPWIDKFGCTFFEATTAIGLKYFLDHKVDVAIIEVGCGGRLDSTNVITPFISIITGIDYDHQGMLGNSLIEIAREKCGIIKPSIPVVYNDKRDFVKRFIRDYGRKRGSVVIDASSKEIKTLKISDKRTISFSLHGDNVVTVFNLLPNYQLFNLKTVLSALKIIQKRYKVGREDLVKALSAVSVKGRMQYIKTNPRLMMDAAHNYEGFKQLAKEINLLKFNNLHLVTGIVKDKDIEKYLKIVLSLPGKKYFVQPQIERGMDVKLLKERVGSDYLDSCSFHDSVSKGYCEALRNYRDGDLIFVTGSHFVLGDLLSYINEEGLSAK